MDHNVTDSEILKDLLLDLVKGQAVVQSNIASIKADLKEHMRRTAALESEVKFLHRQVNLAHGAIGLITLVGIVAAIYKNLFVA